MWLTEPFLTYLRYERNYSDATVTAYGEDIAQLQQFVEKEAGDLKPGEVDASLVRDWVVALMDEGYCASSVNQIGRAHV